MLCASALPFPGGHRLGLFARAGAGLAVPPLQDGFLPMEQLGALGPVGGWNAGFATAFTHAWWLDSAWRCVDAAGQPLFWTEGPRLWDRAGGASVQGLRVEVSADWTERRLVARGEVDRRLIVDQDWSPLVDPTYDRDLLSADLAWLLALARSLGAAIGCGVELDDAAG